MRREQLLQLGTLLPNQITTNHVKDYISLSLPQPFHLAMIKPRY